MRTPRKTCWFEGVCYEPGDEVPDEVADEMGAHVWLRHEHDDDSPAAVTPPPPPDPDANPEDPPLENIVVTDPPAPVEEEVIVTDPPAPAEEEEVEVESEYETLTVPQLLKEATKRGLRVQSSWGKAKLVAALEKDDL